MRNPVIYISLISLAVVILASCASSSSDTWMRPIAVDEKNHAFQFSYISSQEDIVLDSALQHCQARGWGNKLKPEPADCQIAPRSVDFGICAAQAVCSTCRKWIRCVNASE